MNNHVIWLTGLSGSGKSTVANELYKRLKSEGIERIEILDGDDIRSNLSAELGYSKNDRNVNIKRIGYVTSLLARNDVWVIVAAISPYREVREELKRNINNFIEEAITGEILCTLTENDLNDFLHVNKLGHRKKILIEIEKLNKGLPYEHLLFD